MATSASSDRESFLSRPASLPDKILEGGFEVEVEFFFFFESPTRG